LDSIQAKPSPAHAQGEPVFRHPFVQQSRAKSEHKTGLKWGSCWPMGWPEIPQASFRATKPGKK